MNFKANQKASGQKKQIGPLNTPTGYPEPTGIEKIQNKIYRLGFSIKKYVPLKQFIRDIKK
jgi:hypothetical protein